ncbi:MAG TPA: flagellar hook-associated protein FlgK [Dissulfurispiraceae bacterium]|nr:flagellar hook-associated protein FlgK [Dissulfurispiraceae bacterium]
MSILSLFDIGRTSLLATRRALDTTAHNVANSATPGYNRQSVVLENIPNGGLVVASGVSGRGVSVSGVQRMYDSFTSLQMITEKANLSYWETYKSGMVNVENMFNEASDTGIYPAIADFFNAWQEVSQYPEAYAQRTLLINKAEYLATRINRAASSLDEERTRIFQGSQTLMSSANSIASRIAELNDKIASNPGSHDLKDQRDLLLEELNQIVRVTTFEDNQGRYSILIGGTPVVDGGRAYSMSTGIDPSTQNMRIYVNITGEPVARDVTSLVQAGALKANLDLRDTTIVGVLEKLNTFAISLADQINYYHRIGYGLDGSTGNDFFSSVVKTTDSSVGGLSVAFVSLGSTPIPDYTVYAIQYTAATASFSVSTPAGSVASSYDAATQMLTYNGIAVKFSGSAGGDEQFTVYMNQNAARDISVAVNDPRKIAAAAGDLVTVTSANNIVRFSEDGGATYTTAKIPIDANPSTPEIEPYTRQSLADALKQAMETAGSGSYTVTYNAASHQYSITNAGGSTVVIDWTNTTTTAKGLFGFSSITTLQPAGTVTGSSVYPNVPGDNVNASLLANLFSRPIISGSRPADYYQSIVSDVGVKAGSAKTSLRAQNTLVEQLESRRQELSGVNLDEEAANLIKFQKSYEAAAKMISVADEMLDTLLNMIGR